MTADEERLWRHYEPLVGRVAQEVHHRFRGRLDVEDLRQAGLVALVEAVSRMEPGDERSFATYVEIRIRGAVFDQARRELGRSRSRRDAVGATRSLQEARVRDPAVPDGVVLEEIEEDAFLADGRRAVATPWRGGRRSMESEVMFRDFVRTLRSRLSRLEARERAAIVAFDLREAPLRLVGDRLGLTKSGAARLRYRALAHLRDSF